MISRQLNSIVLLVFVISGVLMDDLEGPNVCEKVQEVNVTIKVSYPVPYQVKTFKWCLKVPPRCPSVKTAYKTGYRDEVKVTNQAVKVCCEGFAQLEGRCLPQEVHYHIGNTTTLRIVKELSPPEPQTSNAGIFAGISMTLLAVVAIFLFLLMRYKRKLHRVKEELQYVTYTVDRPQERFDNPLYGESNSSTTYENGPNLNNLGESKITNLDAANTGKIPCLKYPGEFEPAGAGCSDFSIPKGVSFNSNLDKLGEPIYEDIEKYTKDEESVYDAPRSGRPVVSPSKDSDDSMSMSSSHSTIPESAAAMENNTEIKKLGEETHTKNSI